MASTPDHLDKLLDGVHPAWHPFLENNGLKAMAREALQGVEESRSDCNVFDFLRYFGPSDVRVVVLGGSRPTPNEKSLAGSNHPPAEDLRIWAVQGVLGLGATLPGPQTLWLPFAQSFARALSEYAPGAQSPPLFMFWDQDTQKVWEGGQHPWTHPALVPHQDDANTLLRARGGCPIEWNPSNLTYAFTDGACKRNGATNAEASFAVYISSGPLKGVEVAGRVPAQEFAFIDEADPVRGFAPVATRAATPTNNRGEYLAWCWVLLLLLRGGVRQAEIVSDCNLFIQTMEKWLPARRKKGSERELKNYDLVHIGDELLSRLKAGTGPAGIKLVHVNSHQVRPPPGAGPKAQILWAGNERVDTIAVAALGPNSQHFRLTTHTPALTWSLLGRYTAAATDI